MTRTDHDGWEITEGVGATALGVAWARAHESASARPLFVDEYAGRFIDAAVSRGWTPPSGAMADRLAGVASYAAARTKWFDDFFVAAGARGVRQAVILAAGLDARAWRLPWAAGTTVFEIDQPRVLDFKADVLDRHDARPGAGYRAVPVDLREDWPAALRAAGFDPAAPTAWSAEGLLPYLPAAGQDLLFERIDACSAPGSRLAVEAFGADFFDPDYLEARRAETRRAREESGEPDGPDVEDLWFVEDRADVADWLRGHGWTASSVTAADLMQRYQRDPSHIALRTTFVEARRAVTPAATGPAGTPPLR